MKKSQLDPLNGLGGDVSLSDGPTDGRMDGHPLNGLGLGGDVSNVKS
jgi:hypothetical protein